MKKIVFCIAAILFCFETVVFVNTLVHSSNMLELFTVVGIWSIYALFTFGTFIDMRSDNAQRLPEHNRRKVLDEYREFWKRYEKKMREGKW